MCLKTVEEWLRLLQLSFFGGGSSVVDSLFILASIVYGDLCYCKFGFFREDFIFTKLRSFMKIKPSRNGKITLSFIDIGISCLSREFFTSLICLLMLFAKIKFSRKFPNLQ